MNFSTIPCASRGGSFEKNIEATTIMPSMAMPPEWLPTNMPRPRAGTLWVPMACTEK